MGCYAMKIPTPKALGKRRYVQCTDIVGELRRQRAAVVKMPVRNNHGVHRRKVYPQRFAVGKQRVVRAHVK